MRKKTKAKESKTQIAKMY